MTMQGGPFAIVLAVLLLAAGPAFAQGTAPRPAARPAAEAPAPAPPAAALPRPSPMPQISFEELVGSTTPQRNYSPAALGFGAIGGVALFNAAGGSLLPAITSGASVEAALAASRFYVVASAVGGAFVGQWIYDRFAH
jgi:hypothetical protein